MLLKTFIEKYCKKTLYNKDYRLIVNDETLVVKSLRLTLKNGNSIVYNLDENLLRIEGMIDFGIELSEGTFFIPIFSDTKDLKYSFYITSDNITHIDLFNFIGTEYYNIKSFEMRVAFSGGKGQIVEDIEDKLTNLDSLKQIINQKMG